jgi:peptidyl-prolyl cis-trans isomerase-like 4
VNQLEGMTQEQIDAYMKAREAQTRAKLLEIIGDIPDAEMKPPENVLFVCKLNPVTTDEDLELIFSRFGKINSCEIIRDRKTGDSLCYAFIEFDKEEECESAYFKMDNVLIDDRRIHVDFSQSVAKVKWKGKGTGTGYFEDNRNYRSINEENFKKFKIENKSKRSSSGYELLFDESERSAIDRSKYEPKQFNAREKRSHDENQGDYRRHYNKEGRRREEPELSEIRKDRKDDPHYHQHHYQQHSHKHHHNRDRSSSRERRKHDSRDRRSRRN